jgi:hypothetical protein
MAPALRPGSGRVRRAAPPTVPTRSGHRERGEGFAPRAAAGAVTNTTGSSASTTASARPAIRVTRSGDQSSCARSLSAHSIRPRRPTRAVTASSGTSPADYTRLGSSKRRANDEETNGKVAPVGRPLLRPDHDPQLVRSSRHARASGFYNAITPPRSSVNPGSDMECCLSSGHAGIAPVIVLGDQDVDLPLSSRSSPCGSTEVVTVGRAGVSVSLHDASSRLICAGWLPQDRVFGWSVTAGLRTSVAEDPGRDRAAHSPEADRSTRYGPGR